MQEHDQEISWHPPSASMLLSSRTTSLRHRLMVWQDARVSHDGGCDLCVLEQRCLKLIHTVSCVLWIILALAHHLSARGAPTSEEINLRPVAPWPWPAARSLTSSIQIVGQLSSCSLLTSAGYFPRVSVSSAAEPPGALQRHVTKKVPFAGDLGVAPNRKYM